MFGAGARVPMFASWSQCSQVWGRRRTEPQSGPEMWGRGLKYEVSRGCQRGRGRGWHGRRLQSPFRQLEHSSGPHQSKMPFRRLILTMKTFSNHSICPQYSWKSVVEALICIMDRANWLLPPTQDTETSESLWQQLGQLGARHSHSDTSCFSIIYFLWNWRLHLIQPS